MQKMSMRSCYEYACIRPSDTTAIAVGVDRVAAAVVIEANNCSLEIKLVCARFRGGLGLEPLVEVESDGQRHAFDKVNPSDVTGLFDDGVPALRESQ